MRPPRRPAEEAVSALVGTVIVLAMTIAGMGVVLYLGAPAIARLQDQGALRSVVNQFEEVRLAAGSLAVSDAARAPRINPEGGTVTLEPGTRFLVGASMQAGRSGANPCNLHVTSWADGDAQVALAGTDCVVPAARAGGTPCSTGQACVQAFRLDSPTVDRVLSVTAAGAVTLTGSLASDEWRFLFNRTGGSQDVYAEAWILNTDRLRWLRTSAGGSAEAVYEGGAVFSSLRGTDTLVRGPHLTESTPGSGTSAYFLHLPTLDGDEGALSGSGDHALLLSLDGVENRTANGAVDVVRIDVSGDRAEEWCNTLLLRNSLADLPSGFEYANDDSDPLAACAAFDASGVRAVSYRDTVSPLSSFPFQFTEAVIRADLQV